jgi:hypothetical protein
MNLAFGLPVIGCIIAVVFAFAGMRLARMKSIAIDIIVGASALLLFAWIILSMIKW